MESLYNISKKYDKCDKFIYMNFYETYFRKLKELNRKIIIFEIGIYLGDSLRIWNDYFDNCEIYAIDIEDKFVNNEDLLKYQNIHTYQCDVSNIDKVKQILNSIGKPIDIIIDDGSHIWEHQMLALVNLYKYISDEGYYICEDLGTSFDNVMNTDHYNKNHYDLIYSPLSFLTLGYTVPYIEINLQYDFLSCLKNLYTFNTYPGYSISAICQFYK